MELIREFCYQLAKSEDLDSNSSHCLSATGIEIEARVPCRAIQR